jgi:hypothetical protein
MGSSAARSRTTLRTAPVQRQSSIGWTVAPKLCEGLRRILMKRRPVRYYTFARLRTAAYRQDSARRTAEEQESDLQL